jgi:hypothetical protein
MTLIELVDRERARLRRLHLLIGLALAVGITCLGLALGASVLGGARWMSLPRPVPFLIWIAVLAADAAIVVWTARRLERRTTRHSVAAVIEREQALRAGTVRGVMEVAESGALGRRAAEAVTARLTPAGPRLAPAEHRLLQRWAMQTGIGAAVAIVVLLAVAPLFNDGLLAILKPVRAWQGTLLPRIAFTNLPPAVLRGESMHLQITAPRRGAVTLTQRIPGEAWTSRSVPVARSGIATIDVGPLRGDLTIVATDGRSVSDTAVVHVTDRPFVGAVEMRAIYPAYLGRAAEGLAVGEPARVPQGTAIEITGRASTPLRDVRLGGAADTVKLAVNDRAFTGRFAPTKSGRYAWLARGAAGPIVDVPLALDIEVVADSAPRVELVSPAADSLVAGDDRVALHATATDDHGVSHVDVVTWTQPARGAAGREQTQRISDGGNVVWDGTAVLDLAPHELQPGDALHVRIVAVDNSPWAQRGASRELLLRIPTMEERRAIARQAMDSAVSDARSAVAAEKSLEQRTSDAARDRGRRSSSDEGNGASGASGDEKGSMSFEAAEKAKAVAKDQRALTDEVKKLQQTAEQLRDQLKQAGALDSALSRQLQEAQALLRDALSPDLLAAMQKLDNATQQLSQEQAQQSLADLKAMQEKLREQLEKSAEMLKRAALEGAMQTLKDEAKDIANRDQQLADSARASATDEHKAQAKQLADRSQRFSDELKKLEDRLRRDNADAGASGAKTAKDHADAAEDAMRQAAGPQQPDASTKAASQKSNSQTQKTPGSASQPPAAPATPASAGQPAAQPNAPSPGASSPSTPSPDAPSPNGQSSKDQADKQGLSANARDAASQMQRASEAMSDARQQQVNAWKSELTNALDQSIQEMLQMARQEQQLEQQARSGQAKLDEMRGAQSALKQGLDGAAQRLQTEAQKTSLFSGRSQRAMSEAQQKTAEAMKTMMDARSSRQAATALGDAADAMNRAAASFARDREKANTSSSATGFAEMMQQLQDAAKKQGSINAQAQGLLPGMGQSMSSQQQATARALAREQRQVSQQLEEVGDAVGGDRAAQLAKEAKALADLLDGGRLDGQTLARQQQLFRRLLDAGRSLEKEERDDDGKRQATSAKGGNEFKPENANAAGRATTKFREPSWVELRGLSADERRAILEYFKRINAGQP